jgi:hypothetical protein
MDNNKDMRIKELKDCEVKFKGRYGSYIQLSKKQGLKILGNGYNSIFDLRQSSLWKQALMETDYYIKAKSSGLTPKNVKLIMVHFKDKYFPGIQMNHIEGETLTDFNNWKNCKLIKGKLIKSETNKKQTLSVKNIKDYLYLRLLIKSSLKHGDLHTSNIIVSKGGKLNVIDFSPDHIMEVKL